MTLDTDQVSELLRATAERLVVPRWRRLADGEVTQKAPGDYVTVADREAETAIAAELRARVPGCVVVGEEAAFTRPEIVDAIANVELAYVIDPVDGTKNFVRGSADYAVMLCEVIRGVTTRAWIWQPAHGDLYVAEKGAGLWRNAERVTPSGWEGTPPVGRTSFRDRWGFTANGRLAAVAASAGAVGIDYPRLCVGEGDYLVYRNVKPWDHLPGTLMVRELGGVTVHLDGGAYDAASTRRQWLVSATDPEVARTVLDTWQV